jgi:hypothetical protein
MTLKFITFAAALAVATCAFAQAPAPTGAQTGQPGTGEAGETSDRTPEKAAQTPQNQQDTAGGKTSDRSQDKDLKVQHQPGAAGTASSASGASSGESGSADASGSTTATPSAMPPASSSSASEPAADPPKSGAQ